MVCINTHYSLFIQSSVSEDLTYFYVLATVNCVFMNIGVPVSFWIVVLSGYMPRSGIAGSYGNSVFSFLRNLCICHSGGTSFRSHQQLGGLPFLHTLSSVCCV